MCGIENIYFVGDRVFHDEADARRYAKQNSISSYVIHSVYYVSGEISDEQMKTVYL